MGIVEQMVFHFPNQDSATAGVIEDNVVVTVTVGITRANHSPLMGGIKRRQVILARTVTVFYLPELPTAIALMAPEPIRIAIAVKIAGGFDIVFQGCIPGGRKGSRRHHPMAS